MNEDDSLLLDYYLGTGNCDKVPLNFFMPFHLCNIFSPLCHGEPYNQKHWS